MYLIDGYNLLHAPRAPWRVSRQNPLPGAVRALVARIDAACRRKGARAIVVFDGNPTPLPPGSTDRVGVRFTGNERSADAFLADCVARLADEDARRMIVVSSDRTVAANARSHLCRAVSSERFIASLEGPPAGKDRDRAKHSGRDHALTEREVEAWMKEFGF